MMNIRTQDIMTFAKYFACIFLGIYLVGCSEDQSNPLSGEEYEVYEAVFDSLSKDAEQIVILDSTLIDTSEIHPGYLEDSTYKDYRRKNEESFALDKSRFDTNERNYTLISNSEYVSILKREGGNLWDNFYAEFPESNGLIKLSRVGFNQDATKALLKIENIRGELSGGVFLLALTKEDSKWMVEEKYAEAVF